MKLVLVEGLDDPKIYEIINNIENKLQLKGFKTNSIYFPRYQDKSSQLVKQHLLNFPELSDPITYEEIISGESKGLLFVQDNKTKKISIGSYKLIGNEISFKDYNGNKSILNKDDCFYKVKYNNIFNLNSKPSNLLKALLFTIDRGIWFTNNKEEYSKLDYLFINRSYLSNFLYRTIDMSKSEEFLEFLISVYMNEIKANNLEDIEIYSFFLKCDNLDYELDYMRKAYRDNDRFSFDMEKRDEQYVITIHKNFNHLKDLIIKTTKDYPNIIDRYKNYIDIHSIDVSVEEFVKTSIIEDKIIYNIGGHEDEEI